MPLLTRDALIARLCPPLDPQLTDQMIGEFVEMERRYVQRDWKPSELDGAQFCEALARILYHQDSGELDRGREFTPCLKYVEGDGPHRLEEKRTFALHITHVLRTVYKFRNKRGVAHLSPTHAANQMDARLVVEIVRWCVSETLLVFGLGDRQEIDRIIRELLRFDVPCIGKFGEVLLVQRTDLTAEEEVLLLLHHGGELGFTRRDLGLHVRFPKSTVTDALQRLQQAREVVAVGERYVLTDLGEKRFREKLGTKLSVL